MEILTDVNALRRPSELISDADINSIKELLVEHCPKNALGLAAPQLGVFKRAFIANLSNSQYIFVNPEITWFSPDVNDSLEGCLSLPDISRRVSRNNSVRIKGYILNNKTQTVVDEMSLRGADSFIVQHETDHLNGILIIDKEEVKSYQQKAEDKRLQKLKEKQEEKIKNKNKPKNTINISEKPLSKKEKLKLKNKYRKFKKRVERIERIKFENSLNTNAETLSTS